jgi:hypothetical protein
MMKNASQLRRFKVMKFSLHFFLFLFLIFLRLDAYAQFKKGTIITNEGDTLRGHVQYLDWEISPETIVFRKENTSEDLSFSAGDIAGFTVESENERYVSKSIGVIDINSNDVFPEPPSLIPSVYKKVFLQTIIKGPEASLYKYLNSVEEEHFYIETPILFQELTNYSYYRQQNGSYYRAKRDDYKRQLASICINSDNFDGRIPNYNEKELINYLEKYNSCFLGETIVYRSPNLPVLVDGVMGFGYDLLYEGLAYTVGGRISFPKQFYGRFLRFSVGLIPGVVELDGKKTKKILAAGFGKYFGAGDFHPYFVVSCSVFKHEDFESKYALTASVGVNYKRQLELEVGHWNNFASLLSQDRFMLPPAVTLHYYPNFRKKKK